MYVLHETIVSGTVNFFMLLWKHLSVTAVT